MAPLLLLVIAIAGLAIGSDTARDLLMTQLTALVGAQVNRPSTTFRHAAMTKVHCPGVVSASQLGSLSWQ